MEKNINDESVVVNIYNEVYIRNNIEEEDEDNKDSSDWMNQNGLY